MNQDDKPNNLSKQNDDDNASSDTNNDNKTTYTNQTQRKSPIPSDYIFWTG